MDQVPDMNQVRGGSRPPIGQTMASRGRTNQPTTLPIQPRDYYHFYLTPFFLTSKYRWWRPLAAIVAAAVMAAVVTILISGVAIGVDALLGRDVATAPASGKVTITPSLFTANNLALAALIPVVYGAQFVFFKQSPGWLSSVVGELRWRWLLQMFALAIVGYLVLYLILSRIEPFRAFGNHPEFWTYLILMLLTTPLQATAEEFAFRGFLPRAVAALIPIRNVGMIIGWVVASLIFMSLHGAGDPWLNGFYFTFGMLMSLITWVTGGVSTAIALHVTNNVLALGLTFWSGQIDSLFDRQAGAAGPLEVLPTLALLVVLCGIAAWRARRVGLDRVAAPAGAPPLPANRALR